MTVEEEEMIRPNSRGEMTVVGSSIRVDVASRL